MSLLSDSGPEGMYGNDNNNNETTTITDNVVDDENKVVPLIFAVNAIANDADQALFDTFLQALRSSSLEEDDTTGELSNNSSTNARFGPSSSAVRRSISLFRSDDDEEYDSDIDENYLESGGGGSNTNKRRSNLPGGTSSAFGRNSTNNSTTSHHHHPALDPNVVSYCQQLNQQNYSKYFFNNVRIVSVSARYGFPPSKDPMGTNNIAHTLSSTVQKITYQHPKKRLQVVGSSQQPILRQEEKQAMIQSVFSEYKSAMNGILPSGWIEKHVHALPSVILVVCTVSATNRMTEQRKQDQYLFETVEHLQYSLVPKRKCNIQIVALLHKDVTNQQAETWTTTIYNEILHNTPNIEDATNTMSTSEIASTYQQQQQQVSILNLRVDEDISNPNTSTTTSAMKVLHKATRDASLLYYLRQARRCRIKLAKLILISNDDASNSTKRRIGRNPKSSTAVSPPPPIGLSPIIIRTCIKIATFYEFQLKKHEKLILFLNEAYRYVTKYYQWLVKTDSGTFNITNEDDTVSIGSSEYNYNASATTATTTSSENGDVSEGIEIEFSTSTNNDLLLSGKSNHTRQSMVMPVTKFAWSRFIPIPIDENIIYQCRTMADWLHTKLITLAIATKSTAGYTIVAQQWRAHIRTFGCSITSKIATQKKFNGDDDDDDADDFAGDDNEGTDNDIMANMDWYDWLCISRQRIALCQLLERFPLQSSFDEDTILDTNSTLTSRNISDEVKITTSVWRNYVSTTEALLRLGREIEKHKHRIGYVPSSNQEINSIKTTTSSDNMRYRYVGGISNESIENQFHQECTIHHREMALEYISKAITHFEAELIREKRGFYAEDEFSEKCSSRTGARIYYLAGGILLGLNRHEDAAANLIKAAKYAKGWRELELCIRRMLIECYEKANKALTSGEANENSETLVSMILDSYFNAQMSSKDLRRALSHFAAISGGETLKWYHATTGEDNTVGLPFSFAVSFPRKTHATAGDTVEASVMITSHLDYAVHVNSVVIKSLAGNIPIESMDLVRAKNASEGNEGGIIIQAQTSIIVSTNVKLPRDITKIASDDSGNGGEQQGVAGKGSFAKSARPRTAGITAAGGARLVSEDKLLPGNRNSQGWNMRYLGGKPLLCDGLQIVFYPVQAEISSGGTETVTLIELTIEKKSSRTSANIKRTPFEEENYIASAWSRPIDLPLSRGPRSIRVLGPQPQLVVTNVTETITSGKALEGTVNRILLKLQAGSAERCSNVQISVTCFSVLLTPGGTTKRLISEDAIQTETENSLDMTMGCFRTPAIVTKTNDETSKGSAYGYDLPLGWNLAGTGNSHTYNCSISLKEGEASFVHVDFFRPATVNTSQKEIFSVDEDVDIGSLADYSLCKTDYYVTIKYQQERPSSVKNKIVKRSIRRRPQMGSATKNVDDTIEPRDLNDGVEGDGQDRYDEVYLEKNGTLVWASPLSASFEPGNRIGYPSGSSHASNILDPVNATPRNEILLVDGECVTTKCLLQLDPAMQGMDTEIVSVRFEDTCDHSSSASFNLLSYDPSSTAKDVIYQATNNDPCRILSAGSSFGVSFAVRGKLQNVFDGGVSTALGNILVDWLPSPLSLPSEHATSDCSALGGILAHGPLALQNPATIRFRGPSCFLGSVPFETQRILPQSDLVLGNPFEVQYLIKNKTTIHQLLHFHLDESASATTDGGLIVSGLLDGELSLAPLEQQIISLTVLPTRPGDLTFPGLQVSSERYNSWVMHPGSRSSQIFVLP